MIRNIQIDNLFGRFNYNISTKIEGITIITGPNGFGKSTILRIINALSKGIFLLHRATIFCIASKLFASLLKD